MNSVEVQVAPGQQPPTIRSSSRVEGWPIVGWSALVLLAMVTTLGAVFGAEEDGVRVIIRATARSSLLLFLTAFVASSLHRLWHSPVSAWLLRNRRYIGVSFAVSHTLHLGAIVTFGTRWPQSFTKQVDAATLVGGTIGYVFIVAMAATSSDAAVRKLGALQWKRLHTVGAWVLFGIFAVNYIPAAVISPQYLPIGIAILAALAVRVTARVLRRRYSEEPAR